MQRRHCWILLLTLQHDSSWRRIFFAISPGLIHHLFYLSYSFHIIVSLFTSSILILIYACYAIEIYILSKSFSQKQPFDVFCYIGVLLISDKPSLKFVTKTLKGTCQEVHSWNMKNSEGLKSTPERKNNNFSTGIFHRFC